MIIGYKCPYCEFVITSLPDLRNHIFKNHKSDNIKCPFCNFIANDWSDFSLHLLMTNEKNHDDLLKLLLNQIDELIVKDNIFEIEIKENENEISQNFIVCPYCNEKFNRISDLKSHINNVHLLYDYSCPYCKKDFKAPFLLLAHLWNTNDKLHRNLHYLLTTDKNDLKRKNKKMM